MLQITNTTLHILYARTHCRFWSSMLHIRLYTLHLDRCRSASRLLLTVIPHKHIKALCGLPDLHDLVAAIETDSAD